MRYLKTILFILLLASQVESVGQVFPVQSTVQLTPPYSLYLSDYAAPGSERLRVTAFLIDATRPELNVRFRLRIEGNGIKIETKPEFMPPPVTLLGGVPLQLISSDLAAYFDPRNLNFTGITQREIEQRGALPEGLYQFCFEVIEYNRGVKISNTGCAVAWLILNDPPIVNVPADNEKIRIQDPQQVIFQWTPRHRGTPNSAFNAEYDFKLVEVWPSTRNPNDAILTSPVIFQTTTNETTIIYGPAETPLEPGRRYAFQLRAHAYAGADELSLFKNNGYSQVYTFVYGDACLPPKNILVSDVGTTRFNVSWDGASNQTSYALRYRLSPQSPSPNAQVPSSNWYTNESLTPNVTVNSLQPNTRYEFQVNAGCGTFTSDYSLLTNVTTKDNPGIQYSCGVPLTPFNLDPSQLINSLKVGDVIKAGDFDVVLSKVSGSNGTFSGEGVIEVSYFNQAKVKAEFTNININNEMRMVNGYMNVTGAGVEVIPAGVMNLMDNLDEALAQADKALDEYEANLPQQFDENAAVTSTLITVPGTATVMPGSNGSVVIVDGSGKRTEVPAGTTASVVDSSGKGYIIDSKGKVHTTTAAIATAAAKREYNLKLKFAEAQDQKFGFDAKRYDPIASTYTKVEDQFLSWKSVATGQTDNVIAQLEGTGIDKSKIRFELNGSVVNSQWSSGSSAPAANDQSTISILGAGDGVESELIALYEPNSQVPSPNSQFPIPKTQVLGKLSVIAYDQIVKDLVIVPVNGNKYPYSEDALRAQFNKIYGQAVVKWNITFASNLDVPGIDPFDDGGSGLLSNYSPDMRKVVNAYKANLQPNTYYLFLVKNPKSSTLAGFMPRSKECGFIFVDKNGSEESIIRTMAHELGHGAFSLRHTFTEEKNTLPEKGTDNLMDYANGNKLFKYQWDRMRYPEIVMGLFEGDEDGALISEFIDDAVKVTYTIETGQTCFASSSYLAPNGKPIDFTGLSIKSLLYSKSFEKRYFVVAIEDANGIHKAQYDKAGVFKDYKNFIVKYKEGSTSVKAIWYDNECFFRFSCIPNWLPPAGDVSYAEVAYKIDKAIESTQDYSRPWTTVSALACQNYIDATNGALNSKVYDYLNRILNGSRVNPLTGNRISIEAKTVLTSTNPSLNKIKVELKDDAIYIDGYKVTLQDYQVLLWLEVNGEEKIVVKQIQLGSRINSSISSSLDAWRDGLAWDQRSFLSKLGGLGYQALDAYFTVNYDLLDMLSVGIGKLKIPPSVYDPTHPEYNPLYANVFSAVSISTIINDLVLDQLKQRFPDWVWIKNADASQMQFMFFCGMYNGLIGVVQSVPDLMKLMMAPLSERVRTEASLQFEQFTELEIKVISITGDEIIVCKKDEYWCKLWEMLGSGLSEMFKDANKSAYMAGEIIGPILVTCLGDVAAGEAVLAKVASTTIQVLKWCDNFGDVFRFLGAGTSLIKKTSGKLYVQVKNSAGALLEQVDDDLYRIKVFLENATEPTYLSSNKLQLESFVLAGSRGDLVSLPDGSQRFTLFESATNSSKSLDNLAENIQITTASLQRFLDLGLTSKMVKDLTSSFGTDGVSVSKLMDILTQTSRLPDGTIKVKGLVSDLINSPSLRTALKNGNMQLDAWAKLKSNDSKFVVRDAGRISIFSKLTTNAQDYIARFSDSKSLSTLQRFLDDVNADPKFLAFVNDPANEKYLRGFLNHKLTPDDEIAIGGLLSELDESASMVKKWLEESEAKGRFLKYMRTGNSLNENIKSALRTELRAKSGRLLDLIKNETGILNLHEYEILTEVPLNTSGGFMKADIMLVKRTSDKAGIEDIVIIENKLSSGTDLTERQLEGFAQISKTGTITAREAKAGYWNGQYEFKNLREKCVKLFDHGKDDVQVVEASMIKIQ